jgi:hypothetical protein
MTSTLLISQSKDIPMSSMSSHPESHSASGPHVHFQETTPAQSQSRHLDTSIDSEPVVHSSSSNHRPSPQRFTNPFSDTESEWGHDNSTSNPVPTLYQTQLPVNRSITLNPGLRASQALPRDRYHWSSYQHPYDIEPPSSVYDSANFGPTPSQLSTWHDDVDPGSTRFPPRYSTNDPLDVPSHPMPRRYRGGFANMLELWRLYWQQAPDQSEFVIPRDTPLGINHSTARPGLVHSQSSFGYDPDDPKFTGTKKVSQDDPEDAESQCRQEMNIQYMTYRQRRKEAQKIKIQFNVTCDFRFFSWTSLLRSHRLPAILSRQKFLMRLARCLMEFGAPSHRIESQLVAAARILEVDAEFIHLPNLIIVCFGDPETKTSETHFLRCNGRLALGNLHKVHQIYRRVVHDEMSARKATEELLHISKSKPIYGLWTRCFIAFWLSAIICSLVFWWLTFGHVCCWFRGLFVECFATYPRHQKHFVRQRV